jgi:hypothetical protein|tara:strand:- start:261 stop:416 length:156 start_codon:yes stop_codon:yes gene_type:complete
MLIVLKWVILLLLSIAGMILATQPDMLEAGLILSIGCFLLFALDVARSFID